MTNIYEVNDLVDFLEKHQITAEQFLYCLLLLNDKKFSRIPNSHRISRPLSQLYKYHKNVNTFKEDDIHDLIDKGLVIQENKDFKPDHLEITEKFEKGYFGPKYKFEQLTEIYPHSIANFDHPSGPRIILSTLKDREKMTITYNKLVPTYKMHDRIMELVEWGKATDNIRVGLEKFVNSKHWEFLEQIKEEDTKSSYVI